MNRFLDFYRVSGPSKVKVPEDNEQKYYKKLRMQSFVAATLGYSLYYVCRTGLNVVKQPVIDSGFLSATQLGTISSCLLFTYAVGKFINGVLCDYCNIKRFMATGLILSSLANLIMGILGIWQGSAGVASASVFITFAIMWGINGWSQSMGAPSAIISLSRWFPLKSRGTFYGIFSASHNFGEGLSFLIVGGLVAAAGWQWGFFGAAIAGFVGVACVILFLHDNPESKGLPTVEVLAGEKSREEYEKELLAAPADKENDAEEYAKAEAAKAAETRKNQIAAFRNAGVWILGLASAFMYISRYAVNGWGVLFLQKAKGFELAEATAIVSINAWFGILGTVLSGWFSDKLFKGNRNYPALIFGVLNSLSLVLFLFGGNSLWVNVLAMILFGTAIGVLICFLGGLMAVDLVPRTATGAALGLVGIMSYVAAAIQDIASGILIDKHITEVVDAAGEVVKNYDFMPAAWFWVAASVISFLLPILNWHRKVKE